MIHIDIGGQWRLELFFGMLSCIVIFIGRQKLPLSYRIAWGYVLTTSLYVFEYPGLLFGDHQTAFDASSASAFAEALLFPLAILLLDARSWIRAMKWVIALEIILIWAYIPGAFIAPSFDLAFIAAYLPFAPMWLVAASLLTIVTHHGSTALLIIVAQTMAYPKLRRWVPLVVIAGLYVSYMHQGRSLFDASERIHDIYLPRMLWWAHSSWFFWLFGTGEGTFIWLSFMIGKFKNPYWIQMHSDWLQIIFTLGATGFCLVLWAFIDTLKGIWDDTRLKASVFGIAAWMLTYHPLRFFPGILFIGLIARLCNDTRRTY